MSRRHAPRCAVVLLASLLTACATLPPPTNEIGMAEAALRRAEAADAAQYALVPLQAAQRELQVAQAALAQRDNAAARAAAEVATARADLAQALAAHATARARRDRLVAEATDLQERLGQSADGIAAITPPDALPGDPLQRLVALDAEAAFAGRGLYERTQAHEAAQQLAAARGRQREQWLGLAADRVTAAELAARTALIDEDAARLERLRGELQIAAARQEAQRARAEAERLRVEQQLQAEELERLRAQAQAEADARAHAEHLVQQVSDSEQAKLDAARAADAELAQQEAALRQQSTRKPATTPTRQPATPTTARPLPAPRKP